jgi:hypothetical protein
MFHLPVSVNAYNSYCDHHSADETRTFQYIMECTESASPIIFGIIIAICIAIIVYCFILSCCIYIFKFIGISIKRWYRNRPFLQVQAPNAIPYSIPNSSFTQNNQFNNVQIGIPIDL